ncbi:MAG: hypothetical protein ACKVT1_11585 [Dehalococcoidia bacterium]
MNPSPYPYPDEPPQKDRQEASGCSPELLRFLVAMVVGGACVIAITLSLFFPLLFLLWGALSEENPSVGTIVLYQVYALFWGTLPWLIGGAVLRWSGFWRNVPGWKLAGFALLGAVAMYAASWFVLVAGAFVSG